MRQPGQSDPNITRSGPKASSATEAYGRMSSAVHREWSATVTIPDSLQYRLGNRASARMPSAHGPIGPSAIGGLPRWSSTNRSSGWAATVRAATSNCAGRIVLGLNLVPDTDQAWRVQVIGHLRIDEVHRPDHAGDQVAVDREQFGRLV